MTRYLLRTEQEIKAFRIRFAEALVKYSGRYEQWVQTLPIWEWKDLRLPKDHAEFIIGLLCILFVDGKINITFSSSCSQIMRNPMDEAEQKDYDEAHKPKKHKKLNKGFQYE